MGEVYKARDTRLDRTVAIKVLPEHVASDPDLKQRFEREAKTISSLNHPHICTLYDIGHTPRSGVGRGAPRSEAASRGAGDPALDDDGIDFLVMEYLEGDTLAQRLEKGALPLDRALQVAIEIADALDTAHRQGIVHRDLKPGNIMLTKTGAKLLDFGLAKLKPSHTAPVGVSATTQSAGLTGEGAILGTLQYMAPEQLEGKEADTRTDIFAFGAVLYEMVTGRKAFEGTSQASLIGAILERDPPSIAELQPLTPNALDRVVRTCVAKPPDERWQTATDLKRQLQWIVEGTAEPSTIETTRPSSPRRVLVVSALAAMAVAAVGLGVWRLTPPPTTSPAAVTRFVLNLPAEEELFGLFSMAVSPSGDTVVYSASRDGVRQLYRRSIQQLQALPIPGTEGGESVLFSPDGERVAFYTFSSYLSNGFPVDGTLYTVPLEGGIPVRIYDLEGWQAGVTWAPNDTLLIGSFTTGLMQVSSNGGTPQPVTTVDTDAGELGHVFGSFLPSSNAVLYNSAVPGVSVGTAQIVVESLDTGVRRVLGTGFLPSYVDSGHIVFTREDTLWAMPFDIDRLEATGSPVPIQEGIQKHPLNGMRSVSWPHTRSLAYVPSDWAGDATPVWVSRDGEERPVVLREAVEGSLSFPIPSPDGTRLAVSAGDERDQSTQLWIYDLEQGGRTQLTFEGEAFESRWSPDGAQLVFEFRPRGASVSDLFLVPTDGTTTVEPERLQATDGHRHPKAWSSDAREIIYVEETPDASWDIWAVSLDGDRTPRLVVQTELSVINVALSPDGQLLAFQQSNQSGGFEIYVVPYPGPGRPQRVSSDGGIRPVWSRDGRELFYKEGTRMMRVAVETTPELRFELPTTLFDKADATSAYDVAPDGRFLMIRGAVLDQMVVVLNWVEELKQRVPVN